MGLPRRRGDIALGLPPVPQQTQSGDWPRDSQASRKHDITSLAALTRILQAGREGKGRRGGGVVGWWARLAEPTCVIKQLEGALLGLARGVSGGKLHEEICTVCRLGSEPQYMNMKSQTEEENLKTR